MSEVNPPAFLQNAGTTHTAELTRQVLNVMCAGQVSSTALRARGGVNPSIGSLLAVQQAGSPNMSVDVLRGNAAIAGTEGSKQGLYSVQNDATKNVTIAASDPSLPRIDLIVFKVQDSFYSGATNSSSIVAVTGTPASSPAVPTAPANSISLAQIAVGAAVTSIVNANITDLRPWLVAAGGIMPVRSLTERNSLLGLYDGFATWRQDLDALNIYTGTQWRYFSKPSTATVATSQSTSSTTYTDLTTVGPTVTIETGDEVMVTITCSLSNAGGNHAYMSFAVSGATTLAASDIRALWIPNTNPIRYSATYHVTGLTAGTNVFTAKYRVGANTGTFDDRNITVTRV